MWFHQYLYYVFSVMPLCWVHQIELMVMGSLCCQQLLALHAHHLTMWRKTKLDSTVVLSCTRPATISLFGREVLAPRSSARPPPPDSFRLGKLSPSSEIIPEHVLIALRDKKKKLRVGFNVSPINIFKDVALSRDPAILISESR